MVTVVLVPAPPQVTDFLCGFMCVLSPGSADGGVGERGRGEAVIGRSSSARGSTCCHASIQSNFFLWGRWLGEDTGEGDTALGRPPAAAPVPAPTGAARFPDGGAGAARSIRARWCSQARDAHASDSDSPVPVGIFIMMIGTRRFV